jgi:trehalose-6-phosphatase
VPKKPTIEEEIFDDVAQILHYEKCKDKLRLMWHLAKLELDLELYHAKMGIEHKESKNVLEYYSRLWNI